MFLSHFRIYKTRFHRKNLHIVNIYEVHRFCQSQSSHYPCIIIYVKVGVKFTGILSKTIKAVVHFPAFITGESREHTPINIIPYEE